MGTNTDQNTSPSKEKTEPTIAPASKNAKGAKNANVAKSKKKAYQIVGGCVAAALLIACIGFASCNANSSSKRQKQLQHQPQQRKLNRCLLMPKR